jgi:hypothetical protein
MVRTSSARLPVADPLALRDRGGRPRRVTNLLTVSARIAAVLRGLDGLDVCRLRRTDQADLRAVVYWRPEMASGAGADVLARGAAQVLGIGDRTGCRRCGRTPWTRCEPGRPTGGGRLAGALAAAGRRPESGRRLQEGLVRMVGQGRQGTRRPVPRRARGPGHGNHPAAGRRPDLRSAGTAARARSPVHPHKQHGRGGRPGPGPARHRPWH